MGLDDFNEEWFYKNIIPLDELMEILYGGISLSEVRDGFIIDVSSKCENNSYQSNMDRTYSGTVKVQNTFSDLEFQEATFNFRIRDGNSVGTEVLYIEVENITLLLNKVDKKTKKEDTMKVGGVGRSDLAGSVGSASLASLAGSLMGSTLGSNMSSGVYNYDKLMAAKVDTTNYNLNNKGEKTMTQRKTVKVELFDDSVGILAADSLVYTTEEVSDLSNQQIVHEVLMMGEVADHLNDHNDLRSMMVNEDILQRTGREVMLKPVRLKDLRWVINGVNV